MSGGKNNELTLNNLQAVLAKPMALLQDRQLDSFVWHIALNNSLVELKKLLDIAFPGESEKSQHIIDLDADPFIPDGLRLVKHKKGGQLIWNPAKIELYLSENQRSGRYISGRTLRRKLAKQPVLNANALDYLLANPELIPEEWKEKRVYFWGTIYHVLGSVALHVRFLLFSDGQWLWSSSWLGDYWFGNESAALLAT